jgi:tRNA (guanine37-N1)-methyltransferase
VRVDILSLFPSLFKNVLDESIIKRAQEKRNVDIHLLNIRDFAQDTHNKVDERPYGGGPGMVITPEPLTRALDSVRSKQSKIIYFSPQGSVLDAKKCRELASHPHLIFLCGHYEGIDQRIIDLNIDEEISIGDYVLTNGCLPAMVTLDAMIRFLPGVIGHKDAVDQDSFENELFDCPHYTRPETFQGLKVPEVLLSGNHTKINSWRFKKSIEKTKQRRPDLFYRYLSQRAGIQKSTTKNKSSLSQITIPVSSLKKSIDFYRNVLFFTLESKDSESAILHLSDGTQLILLSNDSNNPLFSLSFTLNFSEDDIVLKCLNRLNTRSYLFSVSEDKSNTVLKLCDPDGHQWKLYGKKINHHKHILEEIVS